MRTIGIPQRDGWHWMYDPQQDSWHMAFVDECQESIVLMSANGREARRLVSFGDVEWRDCEWWPIACPGDDGVVSVLVDRATLDEAKRLGQRVLVQHVEGRGTATMVDIVEPDDAKLPLQ